MFRAIRCKYVLLLAALGVATIIASGRAAAVDGQPEKPDLPDDRLLPDTPRSDDTIEVMKAQIPLLDAADQIDAAVADTGLPGLGGIVLSVPDREVRVYWKGALPAAV